METDNNNIIQEVTNEDYKWGFVTNIETDTIGLKGSPTNVFKSFTPPQKGAGAMLNGDDAAAKLAAILAEKHLI